MEENPTPTDPFAAYRIKRCLQCDYDLAGLPPDHVCPECGEVHTRDMLLLTGWSHTRFVAGTGTWFLRFIFYIAFLQCVFVFLSRVTLASAIVSNLFWLAGFALAAWFIWSQFIASENRRLLVTDEEIRWPVRSRFAPLRLFSAAQPPPKLGRELQRVRLKRYRNDIWELLVASSWQPTVQVVSLRIVLLCSEDEAEALATEVRSRIARANERR